MNTGNLNAQGSNPVKGPKSYLGRFYRIALASGLFILAVGGFSSAWAGDRKTAKTPPIHLAGFSIHVGPGGFHLGIGGGYRQGYRGNYGYGRPGKHFGQRHYYKRPRHFYRNVPRHFGHRHYGKRHNHRGHFKGGRHFRGKRNRW